MNIRLRDKFQCFIKNTLMLSILQIIYLVLSSELSIETTPSIITLSYAISIPVTVIIEEFIFRWFLINKLGSYQIVYLYISSFVFGIMHFSLFGFPIYFVAGLILGKSYIDTQDIKLPIALHLLNNIIAILMMNTL